MGETMFLPLAPFFIARNDPASEASRPAKPGSGRECERDPDGNDDHAGTRTTGAWHLGARHLLYGHPA